MSGARQDPIAVAPVAAGQRLRLLGAAALCQADGPGPELPFAPERRFQLLAYLAHQGDWVSRERLAALFWPDHGADQARTNLRKVMFRLRSLDGLPPTEEHNSAVRWVVATDIQAFERAAGAGDVPAALAHWRGDPWLGLGAEDVPGLAPWLACERQRLRARWRQLLLDQARAEPQPEQAAAWTRLLLAQDELDEEALGLLVRQELRAGHRAAALQAYEAFRQALQNTLGLEPAAATRALMEAPAAQPAPRAATGAAPPTGALAPLPPSATLDRALIGRDAECRDIQSLLQLPGPHWLTLLGPGGVGKTALARASLQQQAAQFADGALAVALEDLAETAPALARVAERLAAHLGHTLATHLDPWLQVRRLLQGKGLLLLLDNLEQLRPAARAMHDTLVSCPGVQVIATSRERLGLPAEQVLALQGLPWPTAEDADRAQSFDAVRLFQRHALACQPRFRLADQAGAVAALCEFVEGHPLALQLAAVWTRHFKVSEILGELRAGALAQASANAPADEPAAPETPETAETAETPETSETRHRSIDAAIDHSWQRLVDAERRLLLRLSVFRGGFTIDAARAVADASLPALAALIDKSLVRRDEASQATPARFSLHPLVLQFAAARLAAADRRAALDAHLHHFLGLLARFPHGRWAEQPPFYVLLDPELENLRLAWHEAVATRQPAALAQATVCLACFFHARARCEDGAQLLDAAEPLLRPDALALAQLQCSTALLESTRSNFARTAELARQSLHASRRRGDARLLHAGLYLLGNALLNQGHYDASFHCYQEGLERARARGDGVAVAAYLNALADVATQGGRLDEAVQLARQSVEAQAALGVLRVDTLTDLAQAQRLAGQPDAALQTFERARAALEPRVRSAEHTYLAYHLALARLAMGEPERAQALVQQAVEGLVLGGQPMLPIAVGLLRARLAAGRGQLDAAQALVREAAADATQRRMTPWQLAALLEQAALWLAGADPTAQSRASAWMALVHTHPATLHESRQRAALALGGVAAGPSAAPATPPTLDEAIRQLLDA